VIAHELDRSLVGAEETPTSGVSLSAVRVRAAA
jgi:hypothetical protein